MRREIVILVGSLFLLTPLATAWSSYGSYEPGTVRDQGDGMMFLTAPQSLEDANKVYFNGWLPQSYFISSNPSVNVGQVGGTVVDTAFTPVIAKAYALLGVWRDCNKDGYIGYGDQGQIEYPVQMPGVDTTLCPPEVVSAVPTEQNNPNFRPPHNDGRWIHEFLPIGWNQWQTMWDDTDPENGKYVVTPNADENPWDLNDTDARVWADYFLPEAKNRGGSSCWMIGYPRGSFHSTGGIVETQDCLTGFKVTDTLTSLSPVIDSTPAGQVSFKDAPRNQRDSKSILNQPNPAGDERDQAAVSVWNCDAPDVVNVPNPTTPKDETDTIINVSAPRVPPGINTGGSILGTANETEEGFDDCDRENRRTNSTAQTVVYNREADVINQNKLVRSEAALAPNTGFRRQGPVTTLLGPGAPSDLGVRTTGWEGCLTYRFAMLSSACQEGIWEGDGQRLWATAPVNRNELEPNGVSHVTYYAFVSPTAIQAYSLKLPGTTGVYAAENCALAPAEQIYQCDTEAWWPGTTMPRTSRLGGDPAYPAEQCAIDGSPNRGCRGYGVYPGQPYNLRDIDCIDYSAKPLRDEGVHWGVLSGTKCA